MKEEETWQGDDWEFGRPSEEPSHTQTHNCSQSCANELAVTTHLGGYQHALIELADALTRHMCSTSLPQCHNAGRGSRGAQPRSRLPCQKANRERPQPPNFRNRTMGSFLATYSHSAPTGVIRSQPGGPFLKPRHLRAGLRISRRELCFSGYGGNASLILRWARDHHIFRPNELIASLPEPVQVNESNNQRLKKTVHGCSS